MVLFFGVEVDQYICLAGQRSSGKSSLLFQHALKCAEQGRSRVLYLCPSAFGHLPLLPQDEQTPPSKTLKQIVFKYPTSLSELLCVFDSLHLPITGSGCHSNISCIIVDDFQEYFTPLSHGKSHDLVTAVSKACAHIVDGVNFLSHRSSSPCPCAGIISLTQHSTPAKGALNLDIVERWFPTVLKVSDCGMNKYSVSMQNQAKPVLHYRLQQTHFDWLT